MITWQKSQPIRYLGQEKLWYNITAYTKKRIKLILANLLNSGQMNVSLNHHINQISCRWFPQFCNGYIQGSQDLCKWKGKETTSVTCGVPANHWPKCIRYVMHLFYIDIKEKKVGSNCWIKNISDCIQWVNHGSNNEKKSSSW